MHMRRIQNDGNLFAAVLFATKKGENPAITFLLQQEMNEWLKDNPHYVVVYVLCFMFHISFFFLCVCVLLLSIIYTFYFISQ
jgi:hypothetical protein